jgi:hypothetical protein
LLGHEDFFELLATERELRFVADEVDKDGEL